MQELKLSAEANPLDVLWSQRAKPAIVTQTSNKFCFPMRQVSNFIPNSCNSDMGSAGGSLKSEASTGAGGSPGGDGGQASLKVSLVISLLGSILPVILNKLW